ncbi:MAG: aspartyl/asparaginyl beta-hydroxylase domain-containing protein [Marinoscillum sp.]
MNLLKKFNSLVGRLEDKGILKRTPGFIHDYEKTYPYFKTLEDNASIIKSECLQLLSVQEKNLPHIEDLGDKRTKGGIHSIEWKTFFFKSDHFIDSNCKYCPETAKLLRNIPRIKQAFFSVLEGNQHIKPHKGYFCGFLRYHLGVIIPNNNEDKKCWIRINDNKTDNQNYEKSRMEYGETYYWKEGVGIMFNDLYLHEAANETDQVRVVLFIDVIRRFPWHLDWLMRLLVFIGYQFKGAKQVAKNAEIKPLVES